MGRHLDRGGLGVPGAAAAVAAVVVVNPAIEAFAGAQGRQVVVFLADLALARRQRVFQAPRALRSALRGVGDGADLRRQRRGGRG